MFRLVALLAAFAVSTFVYDAGACSPVVPQAHEIISSDDTTPPAALAKPGVTVNRGHSPGGNGCSELSSGCEDIGTVGLHVVPPEDNRTPAERMGYVVELEAGTLPSGLSLVSPVRSLQNVIWLPWVDGATDDQEPIDFTVSVRAMDEAGNVGDPVSVAVRHAAYEGGCRVASGSLARSWLPTFVLALLTLAGLHAAALRLTSRR